LCIKAIKRVPDAAINEQLLEFTNVAKGCRYAKAWSNTCYMYFKIMRWCLEIACMRMSVSNDIPNRYYEQLDVITIIITKHSDVMKIFRCR